MYYIYIKNKGVFKKIKPYKLYGTYETAQKAYDTISRLFTRIDDILIKHDNEVIEYVDLIAIVSKNSKELSEMEKLDKYIEKMSPKTNNSFLKIDKEDELFTKPPILLKEPILEYRIIEPNTKSTIMKLNIKDEIKFVLCDAEKFNKLISNDIFKFEFYSLKYVRKIMNEKTLNKDELYRTLMMIFDKSIEASLIIITEGVI